MDMASERLWVCHVQLEQQEQQMLIANGNTEQVAAPNEKKPKRKKRHRKQQIVQQQQHNNMRINKQSSDTQLILPIQYLSNSSNNNCHYLIHQHMMQAPRKPASPSIQHDAQSDLTVLAPRVSQTTSKCRTSRRLFNRLRLASLWSAHVLVCCLFALATNGQLMSTGDGSSGESIESRAGPDLRLNNRDKILELLTQTLRRNLAQSSGNTNNNNNNLVNQNQPNGNQQLNPFANVRRNNELPFNGINAPFPMSTPITPFKFPLSDQFQASQPGQRPAPAPANSNRPYLPLNQALNQNFNQRGQETQPVRIPINQMRPSLGLGPPRGSQPPASTVLRPAQPIFAPLPQLPAQPGAPNTRLQAGFAPSGPPPNVSPNGISVVASSTANQSSLAGQPAPSTQAISVVGSGGAGSASTTTQAVPSSSPPPPPPASTNTPEEQPTSIDTLKEANWNPLELNRTRQNTAETTQRPQLAPSPDIVTVPPGYNPENQSNQPQNFDVSVSAQMGGSPEPVLSNGRPTQTLKVNPMLTTTTITWSPPVESATSATSTTLATSRETIAPTTSSSRPIVAEPSASTVIPTAPATSTATTPTRIRDNSLTDQQPAESTAGVVYGKPGQSEAKPGPPTGQPGQTDQQQQSAGKPYIQAVQVDSQVRPYAVSSGTSSSSQSVQQQQIRSNHNSAGLSSRPPARPMQVGSGFSIAAGSNGSSMPTGDINELLRGEESRPPVSMSALADSQAPPAASGWDLRSNNDTTVASTGSQASTRPRRPVFKPRPAQVRIDLCAMNEDSCEQAHNERCAIELGISSCHCRPGYGRLALRGPCNPVSTFQVNMRLDRLADERRLVYNRSLENPASEEYQLVEFESILGLAGALGQGPLARHFMGAKVNKFFERQGKVWANLTLTMELANMSTKSEPHRIQSLLGGELTRLANQANNKTLAESLIVLDNSRQESFDRLTDLNECANRDLNDCSKFATCSNTFGGFQCHCLPGYEDKHAQGPQDKQGRVCIGCSASYCSNRGECSIVEGEKRCKCRANYLGSRCDIDSEVLAVALGGSIVGLVILVVTFWCLYAFNRRWRREQQKLDAMSATSGLTFNYVNSTGAGPPVPLARKQQGHVFGGQMRQARSHYASDQQAIMGSSSSGSSAASQPIACNPYAASYHYEDAAGLLMGPASSGSSEQTSPSASYQLAPHHVDSYTLSGHHLHPQLAHNQQHQQSIYGHQLHHNNNNNNHHHHHHHKGIHNISQFHPADYRTLNCVTNPQADAARWSRTLQQEANKQQHLVGYYLMR